MARRLFVGFGIGVLVCVIVALAIAALFTLTPVTSRQYNMFGIDLISITASDNSGTTVNYGPGLYALAIAAGVTNAATAIVIARRH